MSGASPAGTRVVKYQGGWTNYVHVGASLCADISPDARWVASSAVHGQLLVRDLVQGAVRTRMNGHWNSVGWIRWSGSGDLVVSSCVDRTARIWNATTGEQLHVLLHPQPVLAAAFMLDDAHCVTGSGDDQVRLWGVESGELIEEFSSGIGAVEAVVPSADGNWLLVSNAHKVAVFAMDSRKLYAEWPGESKWPRRAKWSPDGDRIAVPAGGAIHILRAPSLESISTHSVHGDAAQSVAWSPDGASLAIGLTSGALHVVSVEELTTASSVAAHSAFVWDVTWHDVTNVIATVGVDGAVCTWAASDLTRMARIGSLTRGISAAEWSPRADRIVTSSADGIFVVWDVERRHAIVEQKAHPIWIRSIRWQPGTERFFTASQDGSVIFWDVPADSAQARKIIEVDDLGIGGLWEATWTPRGDVACVSERGRVAIFDPDTPAQRSVIRIGEDSWLRGIAWDPKDRRFYVSSMSGWLVARSSAAPDYVQLWRAEFDCACYACAVSPNGEQVALALGDGRVVLLSAAKGTLITTLVGHESEVWSVTFSPDGDSVISTGADGSIRVWQVSSRGTVRVFRQTTSCLSARCSPSGLILVGSSGAWIVDPARSSDEPGGRSTTLTDSPVAIVDDPAACDLLGRDALVDEIAFFLHRTADHALKMRSDAADDADGFVFHVGGRWGTGKTTLMRQLAATLQPSAGAPKDAFGALRRWQTLEFSAWSHAGLGPAWWSLATTIRTAVLARMNASERARFRWRELNWRFPRLLRHIAVVVVLSAAVILVGVLAWPEADAGGTPRTSTAAAPAPPAPTATTSSPAGAPTTSITVPKKVQTTTTASPTVPPAANPARAASADEAGDAALEKGASLIANLITIVLPLLAALGVIASLIRAARARWRWPSGSSHATALDPEVSFGELPRAYITWLRGQASDDLMVIVDDLDRCDVEYVAEVLTSIHLMSRVPPGASSWRRDKTPRSLCVAVLADTSWLELAVEAAAGVPGESAGLPGKRYGAAYLEKVFIASVDLPALVAEQRMVMVRRAGDAVAATPAPKHSGPWADSQAEATSHEEAGVAAPTTGHRDPPRPVVVVPRAVRHQASAQGVDRNPELMHLSIVERMADLAALVAAETQLLEDYADLMEATPRGVKRTLVSFWINRAIAQSIPVDPAFTDEDIMRWTILTLRWPTLMRVLRRGGVEEWELAATETLGREYAQFDAIRQGLDVDRAQALLAA
ncbi:MAG TPA: P-loop NTPase fold protein [Solirubrobacteraceae bacterium]|jgi:WD40 repeat protein|nr:P-loop NTPase fold protein [Solirubrobacteraceae bacterium]